MIIEGITEDGEGFRPNDWPERLSGPLATFKGRRIKYSPWLHPSIINGRKCLVVDSRLEQEDSRLYASILAFAQNNKLIVHHDHPHPIGDSEN